MAWDYSTGCIGGTGWVIVERVTGEEIHIWGKGYIKRKGMSRSSCGDVDDLYLLVMSNRACPFIVIRLHIKAHSMIERLLSLRKLTDGHTKYPLMIISIPMIDRSHMYRRNFLFQNPWLPWRKPQRYFP